MLSDFAQTKTHKSKTQPTEQHQNLSHQSEPYVNPVIKHTLQSLPIIYGGNINRKRKYNVFMKSRLELNNIIFRVHDQKYMPNERLYKRLNSLNDERQKGYSCLKINDSREICGDSREEVTKTVTKKNKKIMNSSGAIERSIGHSRAVSNQEKMHQALVTPKNKKLARLESVHELAKPRDKCNKQYCSCKSIYDEYQNEIDKKMKQKLQALTANRKQNQQKLNLPRLSLSISQKALAKLDDQESKHKVSFRTKINSMVQKQQNSDDCCHLCKKDKKENQVTQKGILGLIKKKELEEKRNKLQHYSKTQNIGIQIGDNLASEAEAQNEEYGIQADLIEASKKLKTIDQEINTDFDEESHSFRHLQNNTDLKESALKQNKKQPMQHLSHLKEKYKYQKRPSYQSKYGGDDQENQKDHENDQDSDVSPGKCNNPDHKKQRNSKKKIIIKKQDPLNTSNDSIISQNSMMSHLANALASNGKDKSTIFKLLKKKEDEESEREGKEKQTGKRNNKKASNPKKQYKKINLIDQETGLFSIPQEQEYVDYLKGYKPIQKDFKIKDLVKSENFKILKYKDTLYFGEATAENTKNGKALVISPKQIFEGVYENGIKMSGCERNIDGVYMGEFLNGMRHGQGKWIWNNGQVYEGEWKLGTKNGYGTWKSPNGDSYEGEWVLNRQQGKGIHRHKNSVYEGEFVQALKEGSGRQKYINGDEYIGEYYKGKPHGKGKYVWKNGNYYQGDFKDGLRSGYGKWCYSNKAYYEGEFYNDFKNGKGKEIFQNGDQYEGHYFEGEKVNGVYIDFATGKVKEIKIEKKRYANQEKSKQNQVSEINVKSKPKENEKSPIKLSRKPSNDKMAKNPEKSMDSDECFKINPIPTENSKQLKNSKIQIHVEEK